MLSGHTIKFEKVACEYHNFLQLINKDSPLLFLILIETHHRMGCNRGIAKYVAGIHLAEFSAKILTNVVDEFKRSFFFVCR